MNKEFDCVEMKHKAAIKINRRIEGLSEEEELAFWNSQTESLKKHQQQIIEKEVKP